MKTPDQITPTFAPVYACAMYPQMAELFVKNGYALTVHGSLQRDLDLIAIPWVENPTPRAEILAAVLERFKCYDLRIADLDNVPTKRPHGREVYTLLGWGQWFIDLGFMPTITKSE